MPPAMRASVAAFLKELQASDARLRHSGHTRWTCCAGSGSPGRRGAVGPGDPAGGSRLLSLARVEGEASSANRWCPITQQPPEPGDWQAWPGPEVRRGDACTLRDRAAVFYDFHRDAGTGPMVILPALARTPWWPTQRPSQPDGALSQRAGGPLPAKSRQRIPRCIPDEMFNRVFAELGCHRDRALVALWVSTGARASELLGARCATSTPVSSSSQ